MRQFPCGFATVWALTPVGILQNRSICTVCPWWVCLKAWYLNEWFLHCAGRGTLFRVGKRDRRLSFPWSICGDFCLSIRRVFHLHSILGKCKDFFLIKDVVYECRLSWGIWGCCGWFRVLWVFISGFTVFGGWWLWRQRPCWGCAGGRLCRQRRRSLFRGGQVLGCKVKVCWWWRHRVKWVWRFVFEGFALGCFCLGLYLREYYLWGSLILICQIVILFVKPWPH